MVRERGLEPPRAHAHQILNLARLPIPPLPHVVDEGGKKVILKKVILKKQLFKASNYRNYN